MSSLLDESDRTTFSGAPLHNVRAPLSDINEAFLRLLIDLANLPGNPASDFMAELRGSLRHLTEPVSAIAARAPVLLVDMEFAHHTWWTGVAADRLKARGARNWLTAFPRTRVIKVARSTLTLAWHLARTDPASSRVLMGMSTPVMQTIATLQPQQLDRIAESQCLRLRPRWEDRPSVWRQLLAGVATDQASARAFTIRALQLSWGTAPTPS
ncbi:MAG: hypothetical protein ACRET0_00120 [Steroidobacteraceae bacterium]